MPPRQELLDEDAHFIIAGLADGDGLEKWVIDHAIEPIKHVRQFNKKLSEQQRQEALNKLKKVKALCVKIRVVLDNENRWPKHRRLREVLTQAASLDLP